MICITRNILILSVFTILLASAHTTLASEVSGTLSSDGSAKTDQGIVLSQTSEASASPQASTELQGMVVEGRESNAAAISGSTPWTPAVWLVSAAVIMIAVLALAVSWQRAV